MTYKEKAKAYDEAIRKAEVLYKASEPMSACNVIIETIFPELKESEDERIRKSITEFFKNFSKNGTYKTIPDVTKWIDWLEKQKLTKNINKEDEEVRQYLIRTMKQNDINVPMVQKALAWLEKQGGQNDSDVMPYRIQPKHEWGEEDECCMTECINAIATKDGWSFEEKRKTKHWLELLKHRIGKI